MRQLKPAVVETACSQERSEVAGPQRIPTARLLRLARDEKPQFPDLFACHYHSGYSVSTRSIMTNHSSSEIAQACADATVSARVRMDLAMLHFLAACRFAGRACIVEKDNIGQPLGAFWDEIFQNCLGLVSSTAAAIECHANELLFENAALSPPLNGATLSVLADALDRETALKKFSAILAVKSGQKLDKGNAAVQNIAALISLRNAVLHYRPEWFEQQNRHQDVSAQLAHKFVPSALFGNEPLFPRRWASAGCATWAIQSVVRFFDYFHGIAGMDSPMAGQKQNIERLFPDAFK